MGETVIQSQAVFLESGDHNASSVRSLLSTWANDTVASLPDPGNQLCTDDFEGPSPHNVNLAAKVAMITLALMYHVYLNCLY